MDWIACMLDWDTASATELALLAEVLDANKSDATLADAALTAETWLAERTEVNPAFTLEIETAESNEDWAARAEDAEFKLDLV